MSLPWFLMELLYSWTELEDWELTFILEIETDTSIQNVTLSLLAVTSAFSR